jgi:NDP-sugar pyrophosphorylase family protein
MRGNVIIGDNCVIGNSCEIKNSIIMNSSQIPHFNYVGDSLLGTKSHISAGAVISNLKLDSKNICLKGINNEKIETKLKKFGAIIGDEAQIGCNAVINPGSLIGKRSRIYPGLSFRGVLETDKIYKLKQET